MDLIRVEANSQSEDPVLKPHLSIQSELYECQKCHVGIVRNIPKDPEFYDRIYAGSERDVSIDYQYSGKILIFKQILKTIQKHCRSGRLLDYGTGTGAFLREAKPYFDCVGVELGSGAREFALSQGHQVLKPEGTRLPFPDGHFDVVTICDVLEHLPHPPEMLMELRRVLKPKGFLYVKVPHYRAQIIKQDIVCQLGLSTEGVMQNYIHINHFHPGSLRLLLDKMGFKTLEEGFCAPEIYDLRHTDSPVPYWRRVLKNIAFLSVTWTLNTLSRITGMNLGLNIYSLSQKI